MATEGEKVQGRERDEWEEKGGEGDGKSREDDAGSLDVGDTRVVPRAESAPKEGGRGSQHDVAFPRR